MIANARFPYVAYWKKKRISNDNQDIGADTKEVAIRCVESTLKTKSITSTADGATQAAATLALRTDESIAKQIEPDDTVKYEDYLYSVAGVTAVRSIVGIGAKEYIITMR